MISGDSGNDIIAGGLSDDIINGGLGKDMIFGGNGNDILSGNLGADILHGGNGMDTFKFSSILDSFTGASDEIKDFTKEQDLIDLHDLVTNGIITDFSDLTINDNGINTIVKVSGTAFELEVSGVVPLVESDFIL